jgi:hypothetical protein
MDRDYFPFFAGFFSVFFAFFMVVVSFHRSSLSLALGAESVQRAIPPWHPYTVALEVCQVESGEKERRRLFGGFDGERSVVVALAGEDGHAFAAHTNLQCVVVGLALAMGLKGQSVLVAGLLGDAGIEIL